MAAPTEESDTHSVQDRERTSRRKRRSASRDGTDESHEVGSASPRSRRSNSRTRNSSSRGSRSRSVESRMSRRRSSSRAGTKNANDALSSKREGSRISRTSHDPQHHDDAESPSARRRQSSNDDPKATKSYLSARSSTMHRQEIMGRKSSVLGSLHAFLEVSKEPPTSTIRKFGDCQSVVSSASRRRRRSHTPSSASVVGGAVMSTPELRAQRRSRSSSEGAMERSRLERIRGGREASTSSSRKNGSRSSSTSLSRKDDRNRDRSSSRPRSEKSHKISPGETKRTGWWNLDAKEGGGGGTVYPSGVNNDDASTPTATRSVRQTRRLSMTSSKGAETPPGFPAAAFDQSVRTLHTSEIDSISARDSVPEAKVSLVLESTALLRGRRASLSGAIGAVAASPSVGMGDDRLRSRKRQTFTSSSPSAATEKKMMRSPSLSKMEDIARGPLRQSASENLKTSVRKPTRRNQSAESLSPGILRRQSAVEASENLPAVTTGRSIETSQNNASSQTGSSKMDEGFHQGKIRHSSNASELLSPGRRRRKSGVNITGADAANHKEQKSCRRSRSADSVSSLGSRMIESDVDESRPKPRSDTYDKDVAGQSVRDQNTVLAYDMARDINSGEVRAALSGKSTETLSKEDEKRSTATPTRKKGSGHSISISPATSRKDSKEKKAEKKTDGQDVKRTKSMKKAPDSPIEISEFELKALNNGSSIADQFNCSTASLDPSLLSSPLYARKVSSIYEIFDDCNEVDDCPGHIVDEKKNQTSRGRLFRERLGTSSKLNESTVSIDTKQINCMSAAFGAVSNAFSPSCGSPGVLKPTTGVSPSSMLKSDKRVSWVELPVHDPNQLLLKSADVDGGNETCITQPIEQLAGHSLNLEYSNFDGNGKSVEKPNTSLEAAFGRDKSTRRRRGSLDERTVGTTVTSNTGTTDTSEATIKTTNMNAEANTTLNEATTTRNASQECMDRDDGQSSSTTNQITISDTSEGSLGSLSGSSKRSKGEITDGSSSTLSEKRKARRPKSETGDQSTDKRRLPSSEGSLGSLSGSSKKGKGEMKDGNSSTHSEKRKARRPKSATGDKNTDRRRLPSREGSLGSLSGSSKRGKGEMMDGSPSICSEKRKARHLPSRSHSEIGDQITDGKRPPSTSQSKTGDRSTDTSTRKSGESRGAAKSNRYERGGQDLGRGKHDNSERSLKLVGSREKTSQKTIEGTASYISRGGSNHSQSSGELTQEMYNDECDDDADVRPIVSHKLSTESGSTTRQKKSYLPRKSTKIDIEQSKGHKTSVESSLGNLLSKIEKASPVVMDENRSVFSAIQDRDRRKRSTEKKTAERSAERRVSCDGVVNRGTEMDRTLSASSGILSVISAPAPRSVAQSPDDFHDERHRPVVDLRSTQFSNKLNKLRVAF